MANLTLDDIISVSVTLSPSVAYRRTLNSALFLTNSTKISKEDRIIEVNNLSDLTEAGFEVESCEYRTLQLYFAQSPSPVKAFVGVVGSGESIVDAVTACRDANYEWYILVPVETLANTLTTENIIALASYAQSASPETMFALNLTDESTSKATVIDQLYSGNYQKTMVQYDEVNKGKTAIAGIIGYALGSNKQVSKSFTLAYKTVKGLISNSFTATKLKELLDKNVNTYINQGYYYDLFRQGTMMNGDYFDEVYYIDMMVNDLKSALMNTLINNPKIPQITNGLNILTATISEVLDTYVNIEFLQAGTWLGGTVLSLEYGDTLSAGYLIQFDSIENQNGTDRVNRVAPNCYICCKLAGAIEYIALGINVSR